MLLNRTSWDADAPNWVERGRASWSADPSWGVWQVPESDLGLLPDVDGLDAVEVGCGTGYISAWLARLGARPVGNIMIKSELIQKVAGANPHLFHRDVERIINIVLDEITSALARGDRVELRGFGAFTVKHRAARQGRNPRTGDTVFVEDKYVPFFKTGKELRERLNPDEQ